MTLAADFIQLASDIIAEYKAEGLARAVEVRIKSTTPDDANKPWQGGGAFTTQSPDAVFIDPSTWGNLTQSEADTLIKRNGKVVLIADADVTSSLEGAFEIRESSKRWTVTRAKGLQPGADPILWELHAEGVA